MILFLKETFHAFQDEQLCYYPVLWNRMNPSDYNLQKLIWEGLPSISGYDSDYGERIPFDLFYKDDGSELIRKLDRYK